MPRPRRSNLSRQSRNARRIRNIANETTEEAQGIAREERRVSMARLRASQSQEQSEAARETARLAMRNRRANNRDQQVDLVVQTNVPLLNRQQKEVYDTLRKAIYDGNGGLYFLEASGGTAKTFLMSVILATVRARSNIALAVASSGIAATLLEGCRTAHSVLKLPLNLQKIEEPTCNISKYLAMAKVLSASKIIIWDECAMAHKST